jgi:ubiquinone/menaquinone biosynthesis C-methylase UbiE
LECDLEKSVISQLSIQDWDDRFALQANWSRSIRLICQRDFPLAPFSKILEVGSGTGRIISSFLKIPGGSSVGVDLDLKRLQFSGLNNPSVFHAAADGFSLPFPPYTFDQTFCHYLLLWTKDPYQIVMEMKRVTKKGGMVFLFSEPDYGGRIDYPDTFKVMKKVQIESLLTQGANPFIGRQIPSILHAAGFDSIQTGMLTWSAEIANGVEEIISEWAVFEEDARKILSPLDLENLKGLDEKFRISGERVTFVPVFFGWGVV